MNRDTIITTMIIFIVAAFFSFMGWLNGRTSAEDFTEEKTGLRIKLQGLTHTVIGAFIAVVVFACLQHFKADWGIFVHGTLSIFAGAFLGETLIIVARKRVQNA